MAKYITEILQEINTDPKKIDQYKGNGALRLIFEHAIFFSSKNACSKIKRKEPLPLY